MATAMTGVTTGTTGGGMVGAPRERVSELRPGSKWNIVRRGMEIGVLEDLPRHKRYSKVCARVHRCQRGWEILACVSSNSGRGCT